MFQIIEYILLKNFESIKFIQIMIRTKILSLVPIILISRKRDWKQGLKFHGKPTF